MNSFREVKRESLDVDSLLDKLAMDGGSIVSSNCCSVEEIAEARAQDRFAVRGDGLGFVWRPVDAFGPSNLPAKGARVRHKEKGLGSVTGYDQCPDDYCIVLLDSDKEEWVLEVTNLSPA